MCDDPSLCTLTMPAVAQRGRLQVAISTGGTRPSWARQLRERLERDWEEGIDTFSSAARAFADEAD
ncbi:hypothetical protein GCM10025857_01390 [Alicyclobacillus contaminans]|nr:hypothetical protein GCM10025857_01390 [Alicyclobacillus contaminans]